MDKRVLLFGLIVLVLFCSGCIPGNGNYTEERPAGFLSGIWHGWIAPLSLILGVFRQELRVYEPINTGWWYDLAFYMAIVGGFGTLSFSRRWSKKETS